jgi:hypothetical protein
MFIHPEIMAGVIAILFVAASKVASIKSQTRRKPAGVFTPTLLIAIVLVCGSLFWAASWASTPRSESDAVHLRDIWLRERIEMLRSHWPPLGQNVGDQVIARKPTGP